MDNNQTDTVLRAQALKTKNPESKLNRELLEAAMSKSPTGGNAKPFVWQWDGETLEISVDAKFDEHYLNRNHHTTWIALGCLIESIEIAARHQSFEPSFQVNEKSPRALVSFKRLKPAQPKLGSLAHLLSRSTYRGRFQPSKAPVLAKVSNEMTPGIRVHVAAFDAVQPAFRKFLLLADTYLWRQTMATVSFLKEIRFFDHQIEKRGIRSEDLGISMADQIMLYAFSFAPWLLSTIASIPVLNFNFVRASKVSLQNSHFVLFTAVETDARSLMRIGREALSTWLRLEDLGYRIQPHSMSSITQVDAATGHLPKDTRPNFIRAFTKDGPSIMAEQFKLQPEEKVVWLFRVGRK